MTTPGHGKNPKSLLSPQKSSFPTTSNKLLKVSVMPLFG